MWNIISRIIAGAIAGLFFYIVSGFINYYFITGNDFSSGTISPFVLGFIGICGFGLGCKYSTKVYKVLSYFSSGITGQ